MTVTEAHVVIHGTGGTVPPNTRTGEALIDGSLASYPHLERRHVAP